MNAKRGQPPKGERALRDGIKVRLTEKDRARLDRLAERSGVGPATRARLYVIEAMDREEAESTTDPPLLGDAPQTPEPEEPGPGR